MAPVRRNAHSHPQLAAIQGTVSGVTTAPTFDPELKMPVANARSLRGNHSATVLIAAGKLPASARPSRKRISAKPAAAPPSRTTERPVVASRLMVGMRSQGNQWATAWAIAATLQRSTASARPRRVPSRSMIRPASSRPIA